MTNRTALIFYLLVLLVAPLAFGTMETWSRGIMEAGLFLAVLLFLIPKTQRNGNLYKVPGLLPLLLFIGYLLLQIIPMPAVIIKAISPAAYSLRGQAVGLDGPSGWLTLSLSPKESLVEFFRFAAYTSAYFLTVQLLSSRKRLVLTTDIVIGLAVVISIEALFQRLTSGGLIYWFREPPSISPVGPFVYRNHYAGFMEMLFPLALALFLWTRSRSAAASRLKERFITFFHNRQATRHTLYGFSAIFIATTIFISLSRGGIISLNLALLLMVLLLKTRHELGTTRQLVILATSMTLVFVSWFGWGLIVERFLDLHDAEKIIYDGRFDIWRDTAAMVRDFLITGSGVGSFLRVFPYYERLSPPNMIIDHAHNDYLELLATGGVISFLLLFCFLSSVIVKTLPTWMRRRDSYAILLAAGCLAGMISLMLHGLVDFNFYNGANGLYFFMLCGLLVAATHSRESTKYHGCILPKTGLNKSAAAAGLIVASLLLFFSVAFNSRVMRGEYLYRTFSRQNLDSTITRASLEEMLTVAEQLVGLDPLEQQYHYSAGNIALYLNDKQLAEKHYRRALEIAPTDSWSLLQLGQLLALKKDPAGLEMMAAATLYSPKDFQVLRRYSHLLLWLRERKKALAATSRLLLLSPNNQETTEYFNLLFENGITAEELQQAVPMEPEMLILLGNYLAKNNLADRAIAVYEEAVNRAMDVPSPQPWYFTVPAWFFMAQNELPRAMQAAESGLEILPESSAIHFALGEIHRRKKNFQEAEISFNKSTELDPFKPNLHRQLAIALASQNKSTEAIRAYRKAVKLAPENIGYRIELAAYYEKQQETDLAETEYQVARELLENSSNPRTWHFNSLRHYYIKNNRLDSAISLMGQAIRTYPEHLDFHLQLGDIYLRKNSPYRAELAYRTALELDPENKAAISRLEKMGKL